MADCWNCGSDDHFSKDCPNVQHASSGVMQPYARAETYVEHLTRIDGYVDLWTDGKLTTWQKRRAIAGENLQYYGRPVTRNGICLTSP